MRARTTVSIRRRINGRLTWVRMRKVNRKPRRGEFRDGAAGKLEFSVADRRRHLKISMAFPVLTAKARA
jgi:hypothetical protein